MTRAIVWCVLTRASALPVPVIFAPHADHPSRPSPPAPPPPADPTCKSPAGGSHKSDGYATAAADPKAFTATTTSSFSSPSTTVTFWLGNKKLDKVQLGECSLPDLFPGETTLHVALPASVRQAAASRRGARLCISLEGTCCTLSGLLGAADVQSAWQVALVQDLASQWWVPTAYR